MPGTVWGTVNTSVNKTAFVDSLERKVRNKELAYTSADRDTNQTQVPGEPGDTNPDFVRGGVVRERTPEKESMTPELGLELASWRREGRA